MKRLSRAGPDLTHERRDRSDRRSRHWWSIWYGSFNPRRRSPSRRLYDFGFRSLDWYSAHLLAAAIGILLLSVVDAFMTLMLLEGGATSRQRLDFAFKLATARKPRSGEDL